MLTQINVENRFFITEHLFWDFVQSRTRDGDFHREIFAGGNNTVLDHCHGDATLVIPLLFISRCTPAAPIMAGNDVRGDGLLFRRGFFSTARVRVRHGKLTASFPQVATSSTW